MKFKQLFTISMGALIAASVVGTGIGIATAGNARGNAEAAMNQGSEGKVPIFPLAQKAGFKTLTKAIQAAGLQKTLTTDGPFTVFAPTDEAFAKIPAADLEALLADKAALTQVLLYHVVAGEVPASAVVGLSEAETLNGQMITIDASNGVKLNGNVNVVKTDIMAKNGIIHVIDTVLLPGN